MQFSEGTPQNTGSNNYQAPFDDANDHYLRQSKGPLYVKDKPFYRRPMGVVSMLILGFIALFFFTSAGGTIEPLAANAKVKKTTKTKKKNKFGFRGHNLGKTTVKEETEAHSQVTEEPTATASPAYDWSSWKGSQNAEPTDAAGTGGGYDWKHAVCNQGNSANLKGQAWFTTLCSPDEGVPAAPSTLQQQAGSPSQRDIVSAAAGVLQEMNKQVQDAASCEQLQGLAKQLNNMAAGAKVSINVKCP
jgi:hypothetical protein